MKYVFYAVFGPLYVLFAFLAMGTIVVGSLIGDLDEWSQYRWKA